MGKDISPGDVPADNISPSEDSKEPEEGIKDSEGAQGEPAA